MADLGSEVLPYEIALRGRRLMQRRHIAMPNTLVHLWTPPSNA